MTSPAETPEPLESQMEAMCRETLGISLDEAYVRLDLGEFEDTLFELILQTLRLRDILEKK